MSCVRESAHGSLILTVDAGARDERRRPSLDPVALTVVDNYLTSTCRDMGVTMMTTAYSPIFNESLDFSCVIFDPRGTAGPGGVLPFPDRDDQVHRSNGRSPSSGLKGSRRATSSSTTTPIADPDHVPSTCCSRRCSGRAGARRLRRQRRAHVGGRREDPRRPTGRRDRGLPGGLAAPAGEAQAARRGRRRHLEDRALQPPHAAGHLGDFRAMIGSLSSPRRACTP